MNISEKKKYIKSFVIQGLPLPDAFEMVYATDDEKREVEADTLFMKEIDEITLTLAVQHLRHYNEAVKNSKQPADHLKRLTILRPRVFDKEDKDKLPDLNITIHKALPVTE